MEIRERDALLIVDVQRAIDDPSWGERNNPDAEQCIAELRAAFRDAGRRVVHVRHASREPGSTYRPDGPGFGFKPDARPLDDEPVITKTVNSAFIGTDLEIRLREWGVDGLVICGVITNNSVEATVRMAGNLGFRTRVVADACATFARTDYRGLRQDAETVHALSLANLDGEYAQVVTAEAVLRALSNGD